jgi:PKD repeat protein
MSENVARSTRFLLRLPLLLLTLSFATAAVTAVPRASVQPMTGVAPPAPAAAESMKKALQALPIAFEENRGQAPPEVRFLARAGGAEYLFTADGVDVRWIEDQAPTPSPAPGGGSPADAVSRGGQSHSPEGPPLLKARSLHLGFGGAASPLSLAASEALPGRVSYFSGPDPANWHTSIPTYGRIRYTGLYPGVDVVFYGTAAGRLEFDLLVSPGADPSQLRLQVEGPDAGRLRLDGGDVFLAGDSSGPRLLKPMIYQESNGIRREIPGDYSLSGRTLRLEIGPYDRRLALVVDPVLSYFATYLGGSSADYGNAIAVDPQGNLYVAGQTYSSDFPAVGGPGGTGGLPCAFVTKLDPTGTTIIYSALLKATYQAGANGLALDANNDVYLVGSAGQGFPVVNASQPVFGGAADAFVTKLNPAGNTILFSTYLGGNVFDEGRKVAVDGSGNCIVVGYTQSTNFPTLNAFQSTLKSNAGNGFVARYGPTGTLLWSTFLGGTSVYGDHATSVAVDGNGNAYVSGWAYSSDFPTVNAYQGTCKACALGPYDDAFLAAFNVSGVPIYSTYFGGNSRTDGLAVTADAAGDAFLGGQSWATDLPVTPGAPQPYASGGGTADGFVAEFNPAGSAVLGCTYLGGSNSDYITGLSYAPQSSGPGLLGVVGVTNSALDNTLPGVRDPNPPATALGTVYAHRNTGSGFSCDLFSTAAGLPLSSKLLAGDLNGDGHDDVVSLVASQSEVYALLNGGSGTFGAPVVSATRSFVPTDAVVTDLDGDGHLDLVVACRQSLTDPTKGAVNILYGKGDGSFIPAGSEWQVTGQPVGIAVADIDGDGYPDVVLASQTSTGGVITTLLQDPVYHGDFQAPVVTPLPGLIPGKMALLDYSHDGHADLALLYPLYPGNYFSADSVGIFTGDGTGHFSPATTLSTGVWPRDMAVADFNGDGIQDIAVLNYGDGTISVFPGLSPGPGFGSPLVLNTQGTYSYPLNLAIGTAHAGGLPDMLVTFPVSPGNSAQLFTNTSTPGGTISFTSANFGCHQPAFAAFGHFFPPPAAPAGPNAPALPFDVALVPGPFYDIPFKSVLHTNFAPLFSTVESTGVGDTHGDGIAIDSMGQAFVTGDSGLGGIPTFPGAFPFHGGSTDAIITIEHPRRVTGCTCASTVLHGANEQYHLEYYANCNAPPGGFPRTEDFPACPSPSVTIDPGDGSGPVAGESLLHDYAPGTYDFTVSADYGQGDVQQCVGRIEVVVPPCSISCGTAVPAFACMGGLTGFSSSPLAEGLGCPTGSWTYEWNFGDGSAHVFTQNATHAYSDVGTFHWSLTLTFGNLTKTCSGDIQVCGLNCSVNALTPAGCAPLTTSFFQEIAQIGCTGELTYEWDFGDGSTSTAQNPSHTYNSPGKYTWSVTITGANGCPCTSSGTVCVYNFPPATVPVSGFTGCSVPFLATADLPAGCSGTPNFSWTFGDGKSGTGGSVFHTYANAGTYAWTVTVTVGNVTCQQSGSITICDFNCNAGANPTVAFLPDTGPLPVTFTGNGVITGGCAGTITYLWDFGDGSTSTAQNPVHNYDAAGSYDWTLTVKVNGGCPKVCSGTVCVVDCWAHGPGAVCAGGMANFAASGLPGGNCPAAITWAWTFGDGGTSTDQNPVYAYPNVAQTYNWSCTITLNGVPCTKSGATAVCKPVCTVTVPETGVAGTATSFSGLLNAGNCAGAPVTFLWNFGDPASGAANTSTNQNSTHTYSTPGTYTWTFTGNLVGCLCVSSGTITIAPPCTLQCSANAPAIGMTGVGTSFAATATPANCGNLAPNFSWTFGDGGTSNQQSPTHTYATPGTFTWTMTASIPGTTVTCSKNGTVKVVAPPVVTLLKKSSPPFKITATGSNLQNGIRVFITGVEWTSVAWKNTGKIQLTGSGLKTAVPKGVLTTFRFLNPDGGEVTLTWSW